MSDSYFTWRPGDFHDTMLLLKELADLYSLIFMIGEKHWSK